MIDNQRKVLSRGEIIFLVILLLFTVVTRIGWNNVTNFTRADEQFYTSYTSELYHLGFWQGYPRLVAQYLAEPALKDYPDPSRWGYFALTTLTSRLMGVCDQHTIATLSAAAGVVSVILTFLIGWEIWGPLEGLLAAALVSTAPLQLDLGRRALQDGVFCAAVLFVLWIFLRYLKNSSPWNGLFAVLAATTAFAIKPTFALFFPALALLFWAGRKSRSLAASDLLLFGIPPLLYLIFFWLCTRSISSIFRIGQILLSQGTGGNSYGVLYQSGPPYRVLLDLFLVSPIVCLLAAAALAMVVNRLHETGSGERRLAAFLVGIFVVFGLLPTKNVRYTMVAEPVMALLASWTLFKHQFAPRGWGIKAAAAAAILVGISALWIFHAVFIKGGVYDPVTINLIYALHMMPN